MTDTDFEDELRERLGRAAEHADDPDQSALGLLEGSSSSRRRLAPSTRFAVLAAAVVLVIVGGLALLADGFDEVVSVYDGQIAEPATPVEQTPHGPVQIRETGHWLEIWGWAPLVGSTSVNLYFEFPGPSLCDTWASGERAVELALPDSLQAETCDAVLDTSAEKPVRVAIGERRVVVYQSEDLPGSITLTELDILMRGGTVARLGAVDLFLAAEDEWAYDVVAEETRTPATEMDPAAWGSQRWVTPADLDAVLAEPSAVVVTSKVFAGFDDRVACVGVDEESRCFMPADGWPEYGLSRPLTVTADRLSTLELLWPALTALNDAREPVAEGYVIDVPQAVEAIDGDDMPAS